MVQWTPAPEACLSHETALDTYRISDVNPNRIHVTVSKQRGLRRADGEDWEIPYEDLARAHRLVAGDPDGYAGDLPGAVHVWDPDLPAASGHRARARRGYLKTAQREGSAAKLEARHAR